VGDEGVGLDHGHGAGEGVRQGRRVRVRAAARVKEETDKLIYNTVKDIINKDQPSFSQNPGECYDSFWENENGDNEPTLNIDELTKGKTYDKDLNEWVEQTTRYRIDYYYKNDLERRWQYHKTMPKAIAVANLLIATGDYTIVSITEDYVSMGQD
jgi:hypothetical protein